MFQKKLKKYVPVKFRHDYPRKNFLVKTRPIFIVAFIFAGIVIMSIDYSSDDFQKDGKYFVGGILFILAFAFYGTFFLNDNLIQ